MRSAAVIPVAALLLAAPLFATPARAGEIVCRPDYDYSVEVDGSYPHGACFYKGDVHGKWFIDIPENKSGLMLDLTAKKIFAVPRDRVSTVANGSSSRRIACSTAVEMYRWRTARWSSGCAPTGCRPR